MSLHLEFEPHSWYMGFAIRKNSTDDCIEPYHEAEAHWEAYTDDGNTYQIVELGSNTLKDLKLQIRNYWRRQGSVHYNNRMRREN